MGVAFFTWAQCAACAFYVIYVAYGVYVIYVAYETDEELFLRFLAWGWVFYGGFLLSLYVKMRRCAHLPRH